MNTNPQVRVPYRRMPTRYMLVWIALGLAAVIYQSGIPANVGAWAEALVAGVLGGLLWGWILWRIGLYKALTKL